MLQKEWDVLTKDERKPLIEALIVEMRDEFDVEIGQIAANVAIDTVLERAAGLLFNKGVEAAHQKIQQHAEDLEINIWALRREG